LGHIDHDGNKKFSFEEAYEQIPEEWRSPEFEAEMRRQFNEIDTD
jgi:rubredoxin